MAKTDVENVNGIQTVFGPSDSDTTRGVKVSNTNAEPHIEISFEYGDLNLEYLAADVGNAMFACIPKGSKVVSAELYVEEAFLGGTDITVGLYRREDAMAIDADGLVNATDGALANLTLNNVVTGSGALIGNVSDPTYDGVITVTANGTFTAGKAKLLVSYRPQGADAC